MAVSLTACVLGKETVFGIAGTEKIKKSFTLVPVRLIPIF